MPRKNISKPIQLKIAWPILFTGAGLGLILAWSVLSGDQQGRVNLLYLLLVYLFLPMASVIISTLSLLSNKGLNLARIISALPLWSKDKTRLLRKAQQFNVEKYWLFYQSNMAALAFSVVSLIVFFVLLVATDINFVWRSTILESKDLYPILEFVALPWQFWSSAQPDLELLILTQDSRLQTTAEGSLVYADWWRFVLATQLFYSVFLRSILLVGTRIIFAKKIASDFENKLSSKVNFHLQDPGEQLEYATVIHELSQAIVINNWSGVSSELLRAFPNLDLSSDNFLHAGPLASEIDQRVAERWQGEQLVIVKSWEPPLGELADFLQNGKGFVWPMDFNEAGCVPLQNVHLQEWRRFVAHLPEWHLYVPLEFMPKESS